MNITLIGMPGAGKSFYGKLLAKELNYHFIDIDALIEAEGMKIAEILTHRGNKKFSEIETEKTLSLQNITNTVIAPGGSVIYSEKAMEHLQKIGAILYLEVPLKLLMQRVSQRDRNKETPILGLQEKGWAALYAERTQLYKKYANITITQTATTTPQEIIQKIVNQIKEQ